MSLIIKGMKMPKRHLFEAFVAIGDGQIVVKDLEKNKLFAGKIEEVRTPHGRLIDADKLQTAIHGCLCENCQTFPCEKGIGCLIEDVFNLLDEAPAIIEAEVSKNA